MWQNDVFYLLQDHLNSSSAFVDQRGIILATNYYYPYGGNRGNTAFNFRSTKRFTGQYHESSLPGGEGLSDFALLCYTAVTVGIRDSGGELHARNHAF